MTSEPTGRPPGSPDRNARIYELIENAPKTGPSPTIWAFPAIVDFMKVAGQPVPGPWPPHQQRRPDPDDEALPVAIAEPDRSHRDRRPRHALRDAGTEEA
jgi:hypothetical protein